MKNIFALSFLLLTASFAYAHPSYYAMLSTAAYSGDASPSTANAAYYTAYYCTAAEAANLFDGADDIAKIGTYLDDNFVSGKSALAELNKGMNASGYYAADQYTLNSVEYATAVAEGSYFAVAFYGDSAYRVFANDMANTESGHVIFDDTVAATAGEWTAAKAVPEPTSALLLLFGIAGLALKRKRA